MSPPTTLVDGWNTVRIIPDSYVQQALARARSQVSNRVVAGFGRAFGQLTPIATRSWQELVINDTFTYSRDSDNRFNTDQFGAWYCALSESTAEAEIRFHKQSETKGRRSLRAVVEYRAMEALVVGELHDLRGSREFEHLLMPDPKTDYAVSQQFAAALHQQGSQGIVYPSVRDRPGGECIVVFDREVIKNLRATTLLPIRE